MSPFPDDFYSITEMLITAIVVMVVVGILTYLISLML
jgi:hypothetical protein